MNKKASVLDVGLVAIAVFGAAVIFLLIDHTIIEYESAWSNNTIVNSSSQAVSSVRAVRDLADSRLDYIVFALFMGLVLTIIISGWLVAANPIFSFFYFIVIVLFVIVSAILSFVWDKITTTGALVPTVANFPITNFIMTHFPKLIAVVGFIGLVVTFAKQRKDI